MFSSVGVSQSDYQMIIIFFKSSNQISLDDKHGLFKSLWIYAYSPQKGTCDLQFICSYVMFIRYGDRGVKFKISISLSLSFLLVK